MAKRREFESEVALAPTKLVELGAFIRSRRLHRVPEGSGFKPTPRRKTPGLRREEVAALAGISESWYTRIELGTAGVPSIGTITSIARALALGPVETRYIIELAGLALPAERSPDDRRARVIDHAALHLRDAAALLLDKYSTPYSWNAVADTIFRWPPAEDPFERNVIVAGLSDPYYRSLCGGDAAYEQLARSIIGTFRRAYTTSRPTPVAQRVFDFAMKNAFFRTIWDEAGVAEEFPEYGQIERYLPDFGRLLFDHVDLIPAGRPDLFIRVLLPGDEKTLAALPQLEAMGTARRFELS